MGKFKWIAVLFIVLILLSPVALLILPSWDSKVTPLLNVVDLLGSEGGLELGGFGFVSADEESLTLRIDLAINNSGGGDLIFPALNLTFSYGATQLGYGWVNPEVFIPAGEEAGRVPIYARMYKGDAFNQFLLSLIAGHLSLAINDLTAFAFLDSFTGPKAGVLTIPMGSLPLPGFEMGESGPWPPTVHGVARGDVVADSPVPVAINVTDRGGGVAACILSWRVNGSGWQNQTMTGLPFKPLMNGNGTLLGTILNQNFPNYPDSPIPTTYMLGTANGTLPGYPVGSTVEWRIYVIDDYGYTTVYPSTLPTQFVGNTTAVLINVTAQLSTYMVGSTPLAGYTASWAKGRADGAGEGGGTDLFSQLEASGIDIMGALMAGSSAFEALQDTSNISAEQASAFVNDVILPMVSYFQLRGVNPFEVIDQLLGLSGGIPGLDANVTANANASLAFDLLGEGGISLVDLADLLAINVSKVVDALGAAIVPQLEEGATLDEALLVLLNATYIDPGRNATFHALLDTYDAYYYDLPLLVYRYNQTSGVYEDLTDVAASNATNDVPLAGAPTLEYYFGSPRQKDLLGVEVPGPNFTTLYMAVGTPSGDPQDLGTKWQWEYYNGSAWVPLAVVADGTANLTQSGRLVFAPATAMAAVMVNQTETIWVRLRFSGAVSGVSPVANRVAYSEPYVPYYLEHLSGDMFGRTSAPVIPGETDSFDNLLRHMNSTNGYALLVWQLLEAKGVPFETFVATIGGHFVTVQGPVTGSEIVGATAPYLAGIVYGVLLVAVVAAIRGRKGTYAISPVRVKKWYESMLVTPSLKSREEIAKYKVKE